MLTKIRIDNFALISHLEFDLGGGMQVITGETGAGKSIILGALRLLMGERADSRSIGDTGKKSIVEGTFQIPGKALKNFFEENDLDFDEETIVRREITASGKSRAFVNDTPVTLSVLRELSDNLVDIHSQFETSRLFEEVYQLGILDAIARDEKDLEKYQQLFRKYAATQKELADARTALAEGLREADYHEYLLNELTEAQLDGVDLEHLKSELKTRENATDIIAQLSEAYERLEGEEYGILANLHEISNAISRLSDFSPALKDLSDRIHSAYLELQDVAATVEAEKESVETDPEEVEKLTQRLDELNGLLVKHQATEIRELIELRESLARSLHDTSQLEDRIAQLTVEIETLRAGLEKQAKGLTALRTKASGEFVKKGIAVLKRLGLENASLRFELQPASDFNLYGKDKVQLLFQANSGFPLKPIQTAVSGGERSRVMFAVKKIIAESSKLPTLILDEIDTGISGRIAEEMGALMKEMGDMIQMIVITHLPQIASKGDANYKVSKSEVGGKTQTKIHKLSPQEKLQEIAQLLSGAQVTDAAIRQAEELIKKG